MLTILASVIVFTCLHCHVRNLLPLRHLHSVFKGSMTVLPVLTVLASVLVFTCLHCHVLELLPFRHLHSFFKGSMTALHPSYTVSGCGGNLVATSFSQDLQSPGYPNGYSNGLNCVWRITTAVGNKIWVNISDINLENHGSCNYDSVSIYDGE